MAIYDWNHNGKKDFGDDFIEYNIYKESTDQNKKSSYKPSYSEERMRKITEMMRGIKKPIFCPFPVIDIER